MQRKSILKDTIQLTVVQMGSLLLNVWLTHCIGIQRIGNLNENRIFYKKTMPTVTSWHRLFCFESYLFLCTAVSSFMNPLSPA